MDYIYKLFQDTEGSGSSLTYVEPKVSMWAIVPILIIFFILLMSPAIQITLSTKDKWYIGLFYPAFTFVVLGAGMLIVNANPILLGIMTFGVSGALIIFHIIVRKNMRY